MPYPASASSSLAKRGDYGIPRPPAPAPKLPTPYDFAQTAKSNHLSGSFTDPSTGAHYSTSGGATGDSGGGDGGYDLSAAASYFNQPLPSEAAPAPAAIPAVGPIDTSAAHAAAFARAKDQAGQTAGGALASLRSALGGRGMLGSGSETRGTASVINAGQAQLGDVSRSAAIEDARSADDTAKFNYSGAVQQRGQTMSDATSRRGQDLADRNARASAMTSLLRASRRPVSAY